VLQNLSCILYGSSPEEDDYQSSVTTHIKQPSDSKRITFQSAAEAGRGSIFPPRMFPIGRWLLDRDRRRLFVRLSSHPERILSSFPISRTRGYQRTRLLPGRHCRSSNPRTETTSVSSCLVSYPKCRITSPAGLREAQLSTRYFLRRA